MTEFPKNFIALFGMVRHMEELVKQEKYWHNYQLLPGDVKEAFPLMCSEPIQEVKDLGHSTG